MKSIGRGTARISLASIAAVYLLTFIGPAVTSARADLTAELVAAGFNEPVQIVAAPDDSSRLFVLERSGVIKVVRSSDYAVLPTPFLDISALVDTSGTRAANGFVFHPEYANNGHFFIYYCDTSSQLVLARYTVSENPDIANPDSATIFLTQFHPGLPHAGGNPVFRPGDPSHYLYLPMGEGGGGPELGNTGQDLTSRLGKLLRIDVDRGPGLDPSTPYAAPGNLLDDGIGPNDDLIWAYGLRNPWRISFDRSTADLFIGDVGGVSMEEVDFVAANSPGGQNFGWKWLEGTVGKDCIGVQCDELRETTDLPIFEYPHISSELAVMGGYVYRGSDIPYLDGQYIFADLSGTVFTFEFDPLSAAQPGTNPSRLTDRTFVLNPALEQIVSFGEDNRGELYMVSIYGSIFRIVDPDASPCRDEELIDDQLGDFMSAYSPDDQDIDNDGLPEEATVAMVETVACFNDESSFWAATIDAYNTNLALLAAESSRGAVSSQQNAIAATMLTGTSTRDSIISLLEQRGIGISGDYVVVACSTSVDCMATATPAPGMQQPYSAAGDPDGDGETNGEEFLTVTEQGGSIAEFAALALGETPAVLPDDDDDDDFICLASAIVAGTTFANWLPPLRSIRDDYLLSNAPGTVLADAYYRLSFFVAPEIVRFRQSTYSDSIALTILMVMCLLATFGIRHSRFVRVQPVSRRLRRVRPTSGSTRP